MLQFSDVHSADVSGRIWPTVFVVNILIQPNIQRAIARSRGSEICTQMALKGHKEKWCQEYIITFSVQNSQPNLFWGVFFLGGGGSRKDDFLEVLIFTFDWLCRMVLKFTVFVLDINRIIKSQKLQQRYSFIWQLTPATALKIMSTFLSIYIYIFEKSTLAMEEIWAIS